MSDLSRNPKRRFSYDEAHIDEYSILYEGRREKICLLHMPK